MKMSRLMAVCGLMAGLCIGANSVLAQDNNAGGQGGDRRSPPGGDNRGGDRRSRGSFDPAEMQKRMMDGIKERLEFTNDAEWAAVQPLIQKLFDARTENRALGGGSSFFGRSSRSSSSDRNNPFYKAVPEADALQKAIDDKATAEMVKSAIEKFRAAKKASDAKLTAAQEDLRKILTQRQEAIAVLNGWLP